MFESRIFSSSKNKKLNSEIFTFRPDGGKYALAWKENLRTKKMGASKTRVEKL